MRTQTLLITRSIAAPEVEVHRTLQKEGLGSIPAVSKYFTLLFEYNAQVIKGSSRLPVIEPKHQVQLTINRQFATAHMCGYR